METWKKLVRYQISQLNCKQYIWFERSYEWDFSDNIVWNSWSFDDIFLTSPSQVIQLASLEC